MKFTKGAGRSELQRSDVGGEVGRRRWAKLRGPGAGRSSELRIPSKRCGDVLRRCGGGQASRGSHRRREIARRPKLLTGGRGGEAHAEGSEKGTSGLLGPMARRSGLGRC